MAHSGHDQEPSRLDAELAASCDPDALALVRAEDGPDARTALPLILRPASDDVDLRDWLEYCRPWVEAKLHVHGAVLFRGFGIGSIGGFEQCARAESGELFAEYGDLPREAEAGQVYQSTPYPANKTILFHNESSHLARWPLRQFFYCVQPAAEGGATPIVDCRAIYQALPPTIRDAFAAKQLLYVRNFTDGLDVSWQEFFKTADRAAVERRCQDAGMSCEWKADGLRVRQRAPAILRHPVTGEPCFFNQVQLHHPACLDVEVREALRALFAEDNMPRLVTYGDGTPIDDAVMDELTSLYWAHAVSFPWQQDDLLMLDNMLVAHARAPFSGRRKIVVAMGRMTGIAAWGAQC